MIQHMEQSQNSNIYYDGVKLLSLLDINNEKPEIYIASSNRSAGKTTYFNRLAINKFKNGKIRKFGLLYRFKYELDGCSEKFFADIKRLFFNDDNMKSVKKAKGIYHELYLNDELCGYALALNCADGLKKYSHLLSDVDLLLFDEYQSENNQYAINEVNKFMSIHTSLARGNGSQSRYLPVIMISNMVSIVNPYFTALGITERLKSDTKFLRGRGYVAEFNFNESASKAQSQSAFNKAFSESSYYEYATTNVYLNDDYCLIEEQPTGSSRYIATYCYNGDVYAIRMYSDMGILYVNKNVDKSCKIRIAVTSNDLSTTFILYAKNSPMYQMLRYYFNAGCIRFKDLNCKSSFFKLVSM